MDDSYSAVQPFNYLFLIYLCVRFFLVCLFVFFTKIITIPVILITIILTLNVHIVTYLPTMTILYQCQLTIGEWGCYSIIGVCLLRIRILEIIGRSPV